jgi:hypothetical protein
MSSKSTSKTLWIVLGGLSVAVALSLFFVFQQGIQAKPHLLMKATAFERLDTVGAVVHRRMFQFWKDYPHLLLRSDGLSQQEKSLWTGLIKTAIVEGPRLESLSLSQDLPGLKAEELAPILVEGRDTIPAEQRSIRVDGEPIDGDAVIRVERWSKETNYKKLCKEGDMGACSLRRFSLRMQKKEFPSDRWVAALEKRSRSEFVLLLRAPRE